MLDVGVANRQNSTTCRTADLVEMLGAKGATSALSCSASCVDVLVCLEVGYPPVCPALLQPLRRT